MSPLTYCKTLTTAIVNVTRIIGVLSETFHFLERSLELPLPNL
jgi:hypothetical protein